MQAAREAIRAPRAALPVRNSARRPRAVLRAPLDSGYFRNDAAFWLGLQVASDLHAAIESFRTPSQRAAR